MVSCSPSQSASFIVAVISVMNSSVDPRLSSTAQVFAGANIGSISGCTFQIFHGNVKYFKPKRSADSLCWSDDDDWPFFSKRSQFFFVQTLAQFLNSADCLLCGFPSLEWADPRYFAVNAIRVILFKSNNKIKNVLKLVLKVVPLLSVLLA